MANSDLIQLINTELALDLPEKISSDELKEILAEHINGLIQCDFHKLVSLLYRVDVSEEKLKFLLKENSGDDAGKIIAGLIIERQIQKIKFRNEFRRDDKNISDDEKW